MGQNAQIMQSQSNIKQEKKRISTANTIAQKKVDTKSTFQFVDNRPEAVAQRKLQEIANYQAEQRHQPIQTKQSQVIQRVWTGEPLTVANGDWDHLITQHDFKSGDGNKSKWANESLDTIIKWIANAFNEAKAYINDNNSKEAHMRLYGDAGEICGTGSDGKPTSQVVMFITVGGLGDGKCYIETAYPKS